MNFAYSGKARQRRRGTSELHFRCKMPRCTLGIRSSTAIAYVLGAIVDRGREMRGRGATKRRRESRCQRNARLIAADAWPPPTRSPRPTFRAPTWVFATIRSPATWEIPGPATRGARSPGRSAPMPVPRPSLPGSRRVGSRPRPSPRWGCPRKQMTVGAAPAARAARRASWQSWTARCSFLSVLLSLVLVWQLFVWFYCDLLVGRAVDLRSFLVEPGNFLSPATLIHLASRPGETSGRLATAVVAL